MVRSKKRGKVLKRSVFLDAYDSSLPGGCTLDLFSNKTEQPPSRLREGRRLSAGEGFFTGLVSTIPATLVHFTRARSLTPAKFEF